MVVSGLYLASNNQGLCIVSRENTLVGIVLICCGKKLSDTGVCMGCDVTSQPVHYVKCAAENTTVNIRQ